MSTPGMTIALRTQAMRRLYTRPNLGGRGIVSRFNGDVGDGQGGQLHTLREIENGSNAVDVPGDSDRKAAISPDATEFGYRVVSPLQGSVKYTATATEPTAPSFNYYPSSLSLMDDLGNGSRGRTVDTLGSMGSTPTQLLFTTSYLENPEEIIATQNEWDSDLSDETMKPRQEIMKEDPYLSDYQSTIQAMSTTHFTRAAPDHDGRASDNEEDGEYAVDDWDAACELDY